MKSQKRKVAFFVLHLGFGGIESSVINQANLLCDAFDVEVISFYHLEKSQAHLLDPRVRVTYLREGGPNREEFLAALRGKHFVRALREGLRAVKTLRDKRVLVGRAMKKSGADVLISTRYDFSVILSRKGSPAARKVAEEHHHHRDDPRYIAILQKKYGGIDLLFALCESLARDYRAFLRGYNNHTRVVVVPNMLPGMPPPEERSPLTGGNLISFGRLDAGKHCDDILRAFASLLALEGDEGAGRRLFLIGDGPERENLASLARSLGVTDRVEMPGYLPREEIAPYLRRSSVFLMASESEGLPMVLPEAMSYGVPCVAYLTPTGVPDILTDGVNGFVVSPRSEEQYVERVRAVLEDEDLRERLSRGALETAQRFTPAVAGKCLIQAVSL